MPSDPTRVRVLHVLWSGGIGGIERVVHDLVAYQSAGQTVVPSVLFGRDAGLFADEIRGLRVDVFGAGMTWGLAAGPASSLRVFRAARQNDVLHLHGFSPSLVLPLMFTGRPIVFSEHGVFGQGRTRTMADRAKDRLKGLFLRNRAAAVLCNSHFTEGIARQRYRLPADKLKVVYNGIVTDHFKGSDRRKAGQVETGHPIVVGTVGRLAGFKRFDRLLRGVALANAGAVRRVMLVGDGPERQTLVELAGRLGISEVVEFSGAVSDVPRYLVQMDLFVLPSQDETFGLVLIEALVAGLPVVVFHDAGGPVEILERLECGAVVQSEAELAEILSQAARDGKVPRTCALDRIETEFGIGAMADRLAAVYANALS